MVDKREGDKERSEIDCEKSQILHICLDKKNCFSKVVFVTFSKFLHLRTEYCISAL